MASGQQARLDRHALVMALWLPVGLVAAVLFNHGFAADGSWWVAGGFVIILAGFAGHIIINAALGTGFTARETGAGMVLFLAALNAFIGAMVLIDGFYESFFLTIASGMTSLVAAVALTMVTRHGTRAAFGRFDIIRDNNPRPSSRVRRNRARL
ncbi:MAG: hypothetical protein OXK82_02840 [Deltaproteobacteria bacterium]|nr:hypothetical protein [Deltaproteobacteria bacterium]